MAALDPHAHATRELLARNVRRLRRERGLTQEELAHATGLRQAHISEVEAGKRNIALDGISGIARGLSVTVARLFQD